MRRAVAIGGVFLTLLGAVLFTSRGEPVPVGRFRGTRPVPVNPGTDPVVAAQLARVDLRLDPEGRGVLEDGGIPWEGLVSRHGDELEMEVLAVGGVNIARQPKDFPRTLKFKISKDGAVEFGGVRMGRVESR